jgi:hypothetical protein
LMFKVWNYYQEHLLLCMVPMLSTVSYLWSKSHLQSEGITAYAKFGQMPKAAGNNDMLITVTVWQKHLVQTSDEG